MSILIDENTTFIIQGITGREAMNMTRRLPVRPEPVEGRLEDRLPPSSFLLPPTSFLTTMSILIDENTTFIIQGITGREAMNMTCPLSVHPEPVEGRLEHRRHPFFLLPSSLHHVHP